METSARMGVAVVDEAIVDVSDMPDFSGDRFEWEGHCWELVTDPDLDTALLRPGGSSIAQDRFVARVANILKLNVENLVVTEGATINHLVALAIAGATADFQQAFIQNLRTSGAEIDEAVIGDLAANIITSGLFRTAKEGQRLEIDSNGLVMYGIAPSGEEFELVRIGPSGENIITAGDTMVSPSGVQAPMGTFDRLTVGGDSLEDLIAQLPRGVRAWGELTQNSDYDVDTNYYARRGEVQTILEPDRLYRISLSPHYIQTNYGTNTTAVEELRYSWDLDPIHRELNPRSNNYRGVQYRHHITSGNVYVQTGIEFILSTAGQSGNRFFWVMWLLRPEHGTAAIRVLARSDYSPIMMVEDIGPAQAGLLKRWNDAALPSGGSGSQDTTPTIQRYTKTWGAGGYGGDVRNGAVYQGTYSSYGNRWGGWIFSSAMRSDLSGSTIEKFEVYLENAHWYYGSGGTARIVPNDGSYKGVNFGNTSIESANWPRYAGRWVTIPSSWYPYIVNGTYKGVSTYTSNRSLTYYGQFKGSATKFRATYRK